MSYPQGYFVGGSYYSGGLSIAASVVANKITYSNDTTFAQTSANLTQAAQYATGVSDTTDGKGYVAGGLGTVTNNYLALTQKITYSNDATVAQTTANLSLARYGASGISDNTDGKGYFLGGSSNLVVATADKITFSTDTTIAQNSANLSVSRQYSAGISYNPGGKGYVPGGLAGGVDIATTDKIIFSSNTTSAQTTANLTIARDAGGGLSNNVYGSGYYCGGESNGATNDVANTDKITYSNDTTIAKSTANLSIQRDSTTGVSDNVDGKGYIGGGYHNAGGTISGLTDKLTYATDITIVQTTANLSFNVSSTAGLSGNEATFPTFISFLQLGLSWG